MEQQMNQQKLNVVEEVTLIYRTKIKPSERPKVTNSKTSYELLISHWDPDTIELQEEFKVLYLNRSAGVIGLYEVSKGGLTGTVVDVRLIFAAALKMMACSIILAHNHPSGTGIFLSQMKGFYSPFIDSEPWYCLSPCNTINPIFLHFRILVMQQKYPDIIHPHPSDLLIDHLPDPLR
jgi:DNA repair protein RadC